MQGLLMKRRASRPTWRSWRARIEERWAETLCPLHLLHRRIRMGAIIKAAAIRFSYDDAFQEVVPFQPRVRQAGLLARQISTGRRPCTDEWSMLIGQTRY